MRKNYKQKRRSCALCKPHKVGWDTRWTAKEAALRKAMELESQRVSCQDCIDLIDAQTALGETVKMDAKLLDQILEKLEL
jgi:hypothetical protein